MYDLNMIKRRINCVDYAREIGLPITKSGDRCASPLRQGAANKTSFVVNDDFFTDFGSGTSGDVIDFCALYAFKGNRGEAIRELARRAGIADDGSDFDVSEWKKYTNELNAKVERWHKNLTASDLEYLHGRRVSDELIERYKIGRTENGRLSLPYFKNGYCCYYATRHMPGGDFPDSKYMKMKIDEYNQHIVFGLDTVKSDDRTLLVVAEGMFDCLAFIDSGYTCISAITGRFSKEQLKTVYPLMKQYDKVLIVYDNDKVSKAGEKFTVSMAKSLTARRIPFVVGQVPAGYKDISEYYADGHDLDEIIENAVDGITKMCEFIETEEEFEKFARNVTRFMSKTDTQRLFDNVSRKHPDFSEEWLKVLKKECLAAPSDDAISADVRSKHKLRYHGSFGFYEYNGKYWEPKDDNMIESYIGAALGVYRTGSRQGSVLRVLKADCQHSSLTQLNQAEAVNFINGTLDLQPFPVLREHDPDDMFSYCLDYPYLEGERSELWENYIWSVTEDKVKADMLQEWLGYPLFLDCSMQKALVLKGEGKNGKSPYINVLKHLYGKTNVSNVSISDLAQRFQAIRLKSAMVNTASETSSDATGAESKFKQVTCGETISDSFKGKDVIDFEPRAKWIVSANNFTTSRTDDSEGYTRRFCFCNFDFVFVDEDAYDPRNPYHRKADKDIEAKLFDTKQLSGIFNWALEGYYRLKRNKCFSKPADQERTMEDFKETNNPLIVFVKEFEFEPGRTFIKNEDFYEAYVKWADTCNHHRLARNSFLKRVSPLVKQYRSTYMRGGDDARDNKGRRGYALITNEEPGPFEEEELGF